MLLQVMVMSANRGNIRKTGLAANKPYDTIKELDDTMDDAKLDETITRLSIAEGTTTSLPIADNIDLHQEESPEDLAYEEKITNDNENLYIDEYASTRKR